jgi:hypothetical protein
MVRATRPHPRLVAGDYSTEKAVLYSKREAEAGWTGRQRGRICKRQYEPAQSGRVVYPGPAASRLTSSSKATWVPPKMSRALYVA